MVTEPSEARPAARSTRVLLVDDETGLTRLLRRSLLETGRYEVRVADSGAAGLDAVREFGPDVILLDVLMPGMSGREVAARLREDPQQAATTILFLTAVPPASRLEGAATLDGHPCIEKPLHAADVIEAIETTLQARGHRSPPI
jgi:two-component system OmpR family response regulator